MREVDLEAIGPPEGAHDRVSLAGPNLPASPTIGAVQVPMLALGAHMEFLSPIGSVSVAHQAQLFEHVEGAIHGRGDRMRVPNAAALDQLGAGHVAVRVGQDLDYRAALRCPAHAAAMEPIAHAGPGLRE